MAQLPEIPEELAPALNMPFEELWKAVAMDSFVAKEGNPEALVSAVKAAAVAGGLEWRNKDPETPISAERLNLLVKALILSVFASAGWQADHVNTQLQALWSRSTGLQGELEDLKARVDTLEAGDDTT